MTNCVRISILATLAAPANFEAFDYWHLGIGARLITSFNVLLFILLSLGLRELLPLKKRTCKDVKETV